MKEMFESAGNVKILAAKEADPLASVAKLVDHIRGLSLDPRKAVVTLDMSTFTKRHMLLLLRGLEELGLGDSLRVLYTEPGDYVTDLYLPMSYGLKRIDPIPGFVNVQSLRKPMLLVIFLGYEGNRAKALLENLDPNETLLIVPKPAYHKEWEGRTEYMNRDLIALLGEQNIKYAHSQDPLKVEEQISEIFQNSDYRLDKWNCCIAPLGTKPQTLGLFLYWRTNPGQFSIIYAQPLKHNQSFYSQGVGRTWLLLAPK